VARLKARGVLVNAVDRADACDFTLPAIVDRSPVIVAIGTGGVSAGLAAALRQRLEGMLPVSLGRLAEALHGARASLRARFPDPRERRGAIGAALTSGGALDPFVEFVGAEADQAIGHGAAPARIERMTLGSGDPDELTLRQARLLAGADRLYYRGDVPPALLNRTRADAVRIVCAAPPVDPPPGLSIWMEVA
jgi:uroporphyrin-III C-methyltransferase/precorrin-2 dehydrogenase/sirohydrochlorin ferrochelatase